jgi:hypothetical protein
MRGFLDRAFAVFVFALATPVLLVLVACVCLGALIAGTCGLIQSLWSRK